MLRNVVCEVVFEDSGGIDGGVDEEDWESRMRTIKAKVNVREYC